MKNKIGVVSSTYAHYNTEEALEGLSKTGFKYVELITFPGFLDHISLNLEKIKETLDVCKKHGVELFGIGGYGRLLKGEGSIYAFKKVIDLASLIGINYITTDTGEIKDETGKELFLKEIRILGDYADEKDVTIGIEIHGDWCKNGKIAAGLIEEINHQNIKITYDTGNTIFYGNTRPEDDIKYALPFMGHIHLKDKRGGYKVCDFPALGEGDIDFDKIFSFLKDYDSSISVEVEFDGKKHPVDEINGALKRSYNFLKKYGVV